MHAAWTLLVPGRLSQGLISPHMPDLQQTLFLLMQITERDVEVLSYLTDIYEESLSEEEEEEVCAARLEI